MSFLIRSKNVFTGLADHPQPAAILVEDSQIKAVLPWDYDKDAYADPECRDYGEQLIMPSFIDAHTHMFSGAIDASDYVCDTLGECTSQEECAQMIAAYAT